MSDTDDDIVPNIVQMFPHQNAIQAPPSNGNLTSFGVHNRTHSNFNMPNQYMSFDQRSLYSRRETSPMSMMNFPTSRMQRSVCDGRCRSPMSVRSIGSNSSAIDVALSIKTGQFNKYDLRMIYKAYKSVTRNHTRKRIGNRRNFKSLLRQYGRKSGSESGVEGSDSSMSSDGCRSTRSAFYKANTASIRSRSQRTDFDKFKTKLGQNKNFEVCTENIQQTSHENLITGHSRLGNLNSIPYDVQQSQAHNNRYAERPENNTHLVHCNEQLQNMSVATLDKRFAKNATFALPFQRFNKCVASPTKYDAITYSEKSRLNQNKATSTIQYNTNTGHGTDDESDEIISQRNLTQSNTLCNKRVLETEDTSFPKEKRYKLTVSPTKQNKGASSRNSKFINKKNDFNFKIPQLPQRKFSTLSKVGNTSEILISKSSQPLVENVPTVNQLKDVPKTIVDLEGKVGLCSDKQPKQLCQNQTNNPSLNNSTVTETTHDSTDVSMKPSFIKRKLFTQKLDVIENRNLSSDNLGINSPQTSTLKVNREKNKVRKLTSQSCLNYDVVGDSDYLDLIHKIVPPDQINTTVANKKALNKKCMEEKDDKWDVTSVISMCKSDDASDTFTDEDIFIAPQGAKKKANQVNKDCEERPKSSNNDALTKRGTQATQCKVVIEKLTEKCNLLKDKTVLNEKTCPNRTTRRTAWSCMKSFWDTDTETEIEDQMELPPKIVHKQVQIENNLVNNNGVNMISKKVPRGAILPVRSLRQVGVINNTKSDVTKSDTSEMLNKSISLTKENATDVPKKGSHSRSRNKQNTIEVWNRNTRSQSRSKENTSEVLNKSTRSQSSNKENVCDVLKKTTRSRSNNKENVCDVLHKSTRSRSSNKKNTNEVINKSVRSQINNKQNTSDILNKDFPSRSRNKENTGREVRNKSTTSRSKNNKPDVQINIQRLNSVEKNEGPQQILNTSRQSQRLKQKKGDKLNLNDSVETNVINTLYIASNECNTSRESLRLKEKRRRKVFEMKVGKVKSFP